MHWRAINREVLEREGKALTGVEDTLKRIQKALKDNEKSLKGNEKAY